MGGAYQAILLPHQEEILKMAETAPQLPWRRLF
jgi:hypothetical protein